jgi:hypothetical protein
MRPTLESLMKRDDLNKYIVSFIGAANKDLPDSLREFYDVLKIVSDPNFSVPRSEEGALMAHFAQAIRDDIDNLRGNAGEFRDNFYQLKSARSQEQAEPTKAPIRPRPVTASKDATGAAGREENVVTSPEDPSDS